VAADTAIGATVDEVARILDDLGLAGFPVWEDVERPGTIVAASPRNRSTTVVHVRRVPGTDRWEWFSGIGLGFADSLGDAVAASLHTHRLTP
jgi:hypothetical protein